MSAVFWSIREWLRNKHIVHRWGGWTALYLGGPASAVEKTLYDVNLLVNCCSTCGKIRFADVKVARSRLRR